MKSGLSSRILIADDYEDSARCMARLLELYGHQVAVALDGTTAYEFALAFRPHVALLDVELPGIDGYDLARSMRTHPRLRDTLLVCLTGRTLAADAHHARLVGFDHFFVKPVEIQTLIDVIDSVPHGVAY